MSRGVQYMHCVMHKCIMVKVGGTRKSQKACTTHGNLTKSGRIWQKHFFEIGGNGVKKKKIEGKMSNLWVMTKKRKGQIGKILDGVIDIFRIYGGKF